MNIIIHDENVLPITIDIRNIDKAEEYYKSISKIQFRNEDKNLCSISFEFVPFLSEVLYAIFPTYFFPYYFERAYQVVVEIFNTFGMFLPPVSKKNDKTGWFLHYFELCNSLYQFRIKNNLDEYDLSAFLYRFAINIIKRYIISEELLPPRKAYFVGGEKKDSTVDSSGDFYIKILPKLTEEYIDLPILKNEKDVEKNLLEPLLIKIGYKKDDWIRQMKIRMGRGHRIYPDYAIFPHEERNNESYYFGYGKQNIQSRRISNWKKISGRQNLMP